jgi:hypothetical protein
MEFALAVASGLALDGAAWRDGDDWCYRLGGVEDGMDRFRARVGVGHRDDLAAS